jgi:hypothetical protein
MNFHGEHELPNHLKCGILYIFRQTLKLSLSGVLHIQYEQHSGVFSATFLFECVLVSTLGRGSVRTSGIAGLSQRASTPLCDVFYLTPIKSSRWIGRIGTCLSYWGVARFIWASSMGKWRCHHPTRLEEEKTWHLAGRLVNPPIARSLYLLGCIPKMGTQNENNLWFLPAVINFQMSEFHQSCFSRRLLHSPGPHNFEGPIWLSETQVRMTHEITRSWEHEHPWQGFCAR